MFRSSADSETFHLADFENIYVYDKHHVYDDVYVYDLD